NSGVCRIYHIMTNVSGGAFDTGRASRGSGPVVGTEMAAGRWSCGSAGDNIRNGGPASTIVPKDHPDGANRQRGAGLIHYGSAVGGVRPDEHLLPRVTGSGTAVLECVR